MGHDRCLAKYSNKKTWQDSLNPELAKKSVELEIAEIDERIKSAKRRSIEEDKNPKRRCIEEGMSAMERCGCNVDDRGKMRANDCLNEITFGTTIEDAPEDLEICIRGFLSAKGIRNATMDSKLGRVAKQLNLDDHPDYEFQKKKKRIWANGIWFLLMCLICVRSCIYLVFAWHKQD